MHQRRPMGPTTARLVLGAFIAVAALALLLAACGPGPATGDPPPNGDVTITVAVIGDGRATLGDLGSSCTDTCTFGVDEGSAVALTAVSNPGRVLVAWDGPCDPFDDTCGWTADEDRTVTVTFAPHALRFELQGDGAGFFAIDAAGDATECRAACGVALPTDLQVTIQYVAEGSTRTTLEPWVGCDSVDAAGTYCLVKVEHATTVGKTWRHPPTADDVADTVDQASVLTVDAPGLLEGVRDTPGDTHTAAALTDPDHGTVTISPDGSFTYQPDPDFAGVDTFTFLVTDAFGNSDDATATITVRPRLSLTKSGGGSVASDPPGLACDADCTNADAHFDLGVPATLTATTGPGTTFTGWSGDACNGSSNPTCDVAMDGPKSVTAAFRVSTYTLTVDRSGRGSGTVTSDPEGIDLDDGSVSAVFEHGTEVTLTATAGFLSTFDGWSGGPCAGIAAPTCTFLVTDDVTVDARFRRSVVGGGG